MSNDGSPYSRKCTGIKYIIVINVKNVSRDHTWQRQVSRCVPPIMAWPTRYLDQLTTKLTSLPYLREF